MENNNVGLLLHKFTKYQTLLANTNDSQKINIYRQKITFYKNKMTELGVNQENLNSLNKLVGGDPGSLMLTNLQQKLNKPLQNTQKRACESSYELGDILVNTNIINIKKNFNSIIDILKSLNTEIQTKITQQGPTKCPELPNALDKISNLYKQINEFNTDTSEQKIMQQITNK